MADEEWSKNEKNDWVKEVGEKKMAAAFHTVINVGGAGRLLVSLFPFKSKYGCFFRVVRGSRRRVVRGVALKLSSIF